MFSYKYLAKGFIRSKLLTPALSLVVASGVVPVSLRSNPLLGFNPTTSNKKNALSDDFIFGAGEGAHVKKHPVDGVLT